MARFPFLLLFILSTLTFSCRQQAPVPPNVVIIFTDDQGYGDVGCFRADDMRHRPGDRLYGIKGTETREPGRLPAEQ